MDAGSAAVRRSSPTPQADRRRPEILPRYTWAGIPDGPRRRPEAGSTLERTLKRGHRLNLRSAGRRVRAKSWSSERVAWMAHIARAYEAWARGLGVSARQRTTRMHPAYAHLYTANAFAAIAGPDLKDGFTSWGHVYVA